MHIESSAQERPINPAYRYKPQIGKNIDSIVLLFITFYTAVAWLPGPTGIGGTLSGTTLLMFLAAPLLTVRNNEIDIDPLAKHYFWFLIFFTCSLLAWGLLSIHASENYLRTGRFFLSYGQGVVILVLFCRILSLTHIHWCFKISTIMFVLTVLLGVLSYQLPSLHYAMYEGSDRLQGFFKNPNQFGMVLSQCLPFTLAFFLYGRKKLTPALCGLICLVGLGLAGSKTNIVIALGLSVLLMIYYFTSNGKLFRLLVILPLMVGSVATVGYPVFEEINPRAARNLQAYLNGNGGSTNTVYKRTIVWDKSVEHLTDNPYFGQGPGQRIIVFNKNHTHSHNIFFDLGRTTGIPGLVLGVALLLTTLVYVFQTLFALAVNSNRDSSSGTGGALVVAACFSCISYILSNQMSDSFGPSTSIFFWFSLGLLIRRHDLLFGRKIV